MDEIEVCIWGVSLDLNDPNLEKCRRCVKMKNEDRKKIGATRNYAIGDKCQECIFQNQDGSYTSGYENLIKERRAALKK